MKVGSIYVGIKGDTSPLDKSLGKARAMATAGADKVQSAYDKAMTGVKNASVNATTAMKKGWTSLKGAWVEGVAAVGALAGAWNTMNTAAKAQQEERAFAALTASYGKGSKQIIEGLKAASQQTVSTMDLIKSAGTAMMMGINPEDTVKLMEVAAATAKMTGQDVTTAFSDISLAVGRQSRMILDNLGIIVDVGKANEEYATALGKASTALTDTEKKQAFMNATLKAGAELTERLGGQTDTAADKLQRWAAGWKNAQVIIGKSLQTLAMGIEALFTGIGLSINEVVGQFTSIPATISAAFSKIPVAGKLLQPWADGLKFIEENSKGAADVGLNHMKETWETMLAVWQEGEPIAGRVLQNLQDQKQTAEDLATSQKNLLDEQKKAYDEKKAAEKQMYEEAGLGAESYYANEANELVKKAKRWQDAGADIYDTEQWLYEQIGVLSAAAWEKGETEAGLAMDSMMAQSSTLVDEMTAATASGMEQLNALGVEIKNLDGSYIGITAAMDGSGIVTEIDSLIAKFDQLRVAASINTSAPPAPAQKQFENTDPSLSAAQVAALQGGSGGTTININQQVSRSDVTAIISEQNRQEDRI